VPYGIVMLNDCFSLLFQLYYINLYRPLIIPL